ncbi:hypothetical protein BC936DRAFT_144633 [Jimgerdemannia flammicorona]|uniref:Isoleucine--tRNA ligase, mitochondrial n=1 Tax=Jimgerdemannia flammicorona TaxID=994334 RepID=A0A433DNI6_9FUNG|nr:hypothetical protein BC936DRAFT_144633 [Jimgerdemannia flammicorona]
MRLSRLPYIPAHCHLSRLKPLSPRVYPCTMSTTTAANPSYADTLLLPKTTFPLRADAVNREHAFRDRCTTDLYHWQLENNPKDLFVLHDGPPYANGGLHIGHAINKILKDITNRYKVLQGHRVHYVPGWDCHGLPIELKALEELKNIDGSQLTPTEIRKMARARALSEVEKQKQGFISWGVMGDWDNAYKTLDKDFEVRQLKVFKKMVNKGYIYRQHKPVYWSPSSKTALAEAELEYKDDHLSRSIYVKFSVVQLAPALANLLPKEVSASSVHALVWTTTPWTIPANKVRSLFKTTDNESCRTLLGESDLLGCCCQSRHGLPPSQVRRRQPPCRGQGSVAGVARGAWYRDGGSDLLGTTYAHPLTDEILPFIAGAYVTAESGTGLVHTAPGHGMEDYEACRSLGIKPFSPGEFIMHFISKTTGISDTSIMIHLPTTASTVDDTGHFTAEAGADLAGKFTFTDGNALVIDKLTERGRLVRERKYKHKYPYDWRTKKPVMLRATAQWFANVEELQKKAVESLKAVRMVPESSFRRIEQFTLSRKEWCISRQRAWGVPIPVLYDTETGEPLLTDSSVQHIIAVIERMGGTDAWWEVKDDAVFVADEYKTKGKTYRRGYDTMDVWFDSGSSWTLVKDKIAERSDDGRPAADLYLEGSDQHRGWFQSSLLTSGDCCNRQTSVLDPHYPWFRAR